MRSKRQRESGLLCCIVDSASGILGKDHDQAEVHENACHIEHIPYNHAVMTWVCGSRVHAAEDAWCMSFVCGCSRLMASEVEGQSADQLVKHLKHPTTFCKCLKAGMHKIASASNKPPPLRAVVIGYREESDEEGIGHV